MNTVFKYSKAIVGLLTALGVGLETAYPGDKWTSLVTTMIGAFVVYLVPNGNAGSTATASEVPSVPPVPADQPPVD